jgi:hypothetical protein
MHAAGGDARLAAENAGALSLVDAIFRPRYALPATTQHEALEMESAAQMVGLRHRDLNCSLSLALYKDPVMTSDGFVYDRDCIEKYWLLTGKIRSPLTNLNLDNGHLRAATIIKRFVEKFLLEEIESGKAAALMGSDLEVNGPKALEIEKVLRQICAQPANPPDVLMIELLRLLENVYLRDFACRCGALHVAAAYFTNNKSSTAAALLVRMVAFSLENQQQVQFVAREAEAALQSCDAEVQTHGFHVLAALVADGGTLQDRLEGQLAALFAPLVGNLDAVPPTLCKGALFFAVHLLKQRRASTCELLHDAGVPVLASFVLENMLADPAAAGLACWFFALLRDLPDAMKQGLQDMPGLASRIHNAVDTCSSFGLEALAVVIGPRRAAMHAVEVLSLLSSDSEARGSACGSALCVVAAATRAPTQDQAVFGERPLRTDVVDYVCRNIDAVLDAIEGRRDRSGLEHGLQILRNIVSAIEQPGERVVARASRRIFIERGAKIASIVQSTTQRIVVEIYSESNMLAWNPMDVLWHTSCVEVFAFFRHFIRLLADDEFSKIIPGAKVDIVGACIDVLHFVKLSLSEFTPAQQVALRDMVTNALGILETLCVRLEYRELGHANISEILLGLVEPQTNEFVDFFSLRVLQTLHVLVCSSQAPLRFCMLRDSSAANHCFRREMVLKNMHVRLFNMLMSQQGTKQQQLAVLALLRDTVAEIKTHSRAKKHAKFYQRLVPALLEKINHHVRCAPGCPVTVMMCAETLANLLAANVVPRSLLRGSAAVMHTMLAALRVFSVQSPRPTFVLEQALRVVLLLVSSPCACAFYAAASCGPGQVLRDAAAAESLVAAGGAAESAAATLRTVATLLWLLRAPVAELSCASRWAGFEHLGRPHAARCSELVLVLAQLVLGEHPQQHVVDAFVDSSLVEAMLAALEDADALTHGAKTVLVRTLQRLAPLLPAALAAQVAAAGRCSPEERTDLAGPGLAGPAGPGPGPAEPACVGAKRKLA